MTCQLSSNFPTLKKKCLTALPKEGASSLQVPLSVTTALRQTNTQARTHTQKEAKGTSCMKPLTTQKNIGRLACSKLESRMRNMDEVFFSPSSYISSRTYCVLPPTLAPARPLLNIVCFVFDYFLSFFFLSLSLSFLNCKSRSCNDSRLIAYLR